MGGGFWPMIDVLVSVAFYLSVFSLAFILFAVAESAAQSVANSDGTYLRVSVLPHAIAGIAILLLCMIAALRADTVGVDTSLYPDVYMSAAATSESFFGFVSNEQLMPLEEPFHAILVWLCSRITSNKALLLFCYQFLTIVPVYIAAYKLRKYMPLSICMAVYMLFFYNNSLNLMRQSIACAFLLLAFAYLIDKKRMSIGFFLCSVSAVLFHRSGLYGFVLILIASLISKVQHKQIKAALYVSILILPMIVFPVANGLVNLGLADSHLQIYLNTFENLDENSVYYFNPLSLHSLCYLFIYGWLVALPYIGVKLPVVGSSKNEEAEFTGIQRYVNSVPLMGYLIYAALLFALYTSYGSRFSLFLDFFMIFSLSLFCTGEKAHQRKILVLGSLIVVWLIWVVRLGWSASVPYGFNTLIW